jgi:hypothetical protein
MDLRDYAECEAIGLEPAIGLNKHDRKVQARRVAGSDVAGHLNNDGPRTY